jgi:hypothetical protein
MANRLLKTQNASLKSENDKTQEESRELKMELLSLTLRLRDGLLEQSLLSKLGGDHSIDPSNLRSPDVACSKHTEWKTFKS